LSHHQQPYGDGSQAPVSSIHSPSSSNEKENRTGGGWFSRPKRKDSLHSSIQVPGPSSPHSPSPEPYAPITPSRPESMVVQSSSIPVPVSNRLVVSTSSTIPHDYSAQHTLPSATAIPTVTNTNISSPGTKSASRKMSLSGHGNFFGGWGSRDRDKEKDSHQSNGREGEAR